MIILYHSPFTRSHLIRFALEELELPYELRSLSVARGEHKSAAYLALNPLGQLPTLVDDHLTIREAAAIALNLGDKPQARELAPRVGAPARAAYYQWVVFAVAAELLALSKIVLHTRLLPESMRVPAVAAAGLAEWQHVAQALTLGLEGQSFLLGEAFLLADVMVGGSLSLAGFLGLLSAHPGLAAYFERVSDRPAFRRAYADAAAS
ncbi:MAG TPA: glutathione S-transferase family protein [Polyangiaceae bacterium]|jgi:glutathione S-transferase